MRRRQLLAALPAAFALTLLPRAPLPAMAAPRASGKIVARQVDHAAPALVGALRRSSGERLEVADAGTTGGETLSLTSPAIAADQLFERVGVHFRAARGSGASLFVEVRASADGVRWGDWRTVPVDEHMSDEAASTFYAPPQPVPQDSRYAQYRVWLTRGVPADLEHIALTFLDVNDLNAGPVARLSGTASAALHDLGRALGAGAYAMAATGVPRVLTRQDWAADESLMKWTPKYVPWRKAVLHHTVTSDGGTNVAAEIRSIYYFHAVTRGWGDIGYSYLVDKSGNIWTGRQGGDNAVAGHAYGWNDGTFGIAAIGDYSVAQPTSALQGAIANIVALKLTQLGVAPFGSGSFTHEEQRSDGSWIKVTSTVANVLGHAECTYVVGKTGAQTACPGKIFAMLDGLRTLAQNAWQSGYTYLARIDAQLPTGGFPGQLVNVGVTVADLGITTIPAGTSVGYKILKGGTVVAQGTPGTLAAIAPGASATAQVPFLAPPVGEYVVRWDLGTGGATWNALYNTPVRDTWFRSADWSASWLDDDVTGAWTAGETRFATVSVRNDGGRTWPAGGVNPVRLGYYWISTATGNRFEAPFRQPLPQDVAPGQTITVQMPITAPVYPTNYTLTLDLYKENEFWFKDKGLRPDDTEVTVSTDFKATYQVGALPAFDAGKTVSVPVSIANTGRGTLPVTSSYPVALGYHWYDSAGAQVAWDGTRTKIPADLLAGQSVAVQAQVTAPTKGGTFSLRFDLVQEGVGWFSSKGVPTQNVTVNVAGPVVAVYGAGYEPGVSTLARSGALASVPFTVKNTGNFAWSPAGATPIALSYHWIDAKGQTVLWDGLRTRLAATVAPGASVTLQAQIAFPTVEGAYTLRWDMVQEGVAWFSAKGVKTFDQAVVVGPPPFYGGSIDVSKAPAEMPLRLATSVPLRVQNMSNFPWDASVNLAYHWYDASGKVVVWDGVRTPLAGLAPNDVRSVSATVEPPPVAGAYVLKFDVVQEGVTWFSGKGMLLAPIAVAVKVPAYGALYAGPQTVGAAPSVGIAVPVSVTNVGSLTWQPGTVYLSYHLEGADGVIVWDGQRSPLAQAIGPGGSAVVSAFVKMPATAGIYTLRWDLVQEGITWFSGQAVPTGTTTLAVN